MKQIWLLLLCINVAMAQQNFEIKRIDSIWSHFITYDTLWSPDSLTYTANISKTKMTRSEAVNRLYALTDNQKRVIEAQTEAQRNFTNLDSLLLAETGKTYDQILSALVLKEMEGAYTFQYAGGNALDATIQGNKLIIGSNQYTLVVTDRFKIRARDLMGSGMHVILNRRQNGLTGEYDKKPVILVKK